MREVIRWFMVARAVHAVIQLGVADCIDGDPVSIDDVAESTGAQPDHLKRVLRFLASFGVFRNAGDDRFVSTDLSQVLRTDHPGSVAGEISRSDRLWWQSFGDFAETIRTGQPAFDRIARQSFWEFTASRPALGARFDAQMAEASRRVNAAIVEACDFSGFALVVDVGGGRGGLMANILRQYPDVRGILFDLPRVIENPIELEESNLSDRWEAVAGDFFEGVPPGGDCYVLKSIIHDYGDGAAEMILRSCADVVTDGGRIIVADRILPDSSNGPHPSFLHDMNMMIMLGGKERTEQEWQQLLGAAGLRIENISPAGSEFSVMETTRA